MKSNFLKLVCFLCLMGPMWASAAPTIFVNDEAGFDAQVLTQSLGLAGTEDWESSVQAAGTLVLVSDAILPGVPPPPFPTGY